MNWSAAFDELEVGSTFTTASRTVTEADVTMFSALTGDRHPQHADPEWAAASSFGEQIAHGMLVVSLAVGLMPFDPERVIALRKVRDVVFRRPVRFGDAIRAEGSIRAVRAMTDDAGLVTVGIDVIRQDDQRACVATVDVLWKRDPEPALAAGASPCGEDVWGLQ